MWSSSPAELPALCAHRWAHTGTTASAASPTAAGGQGTSTLGRVGARARQKSLRSLCTSTPSSVRSLALTSIAVWVTCEREKIKNNKAEPKSEQTYLSQAEAKRLQEKPQGQEAPGHGWREQPEAVGTGGREKGERGRSPSRPRAGWRGLEEGWLPGRRGRSASSALTLCPAVAGSEPAPPRPRVSRLQAPGAAAMAGAAPTAPLPAAHSAHSAGQAARRGQAHRKSRKG